MTKTTHKIASTTFTLDSERFSDLKPIGKGSYGVVVGAMDVDIGRRVAIKKISEMAKHTVDAKHILRECRIMRYMGRHENIVTLEDLMIEKENDELYIVMELLDSDLHRVLQSKQSLSENHFKHFMMQILCGLKYLHDNRIIHRDLKPGNILVTRDCKLRITDFGLARERPIGSNHHDPDEDIAEPMTEHVVTRWYRPPELMLCPDGMYTYAVDLWSVGCIFAEMLGRKPLFPGKNFVDQLTLIFNIIGTPLASEVSHIRNSQARKFLSNQNGKRAVPMQDLYPKASQSALALLENLLIFAPERRLTVDEALASSFLNGAVDEDSPSMVFPRSDARCEFEFERDGSTKLELRELIHAEAKSLRDERIPASAATLLPSRGTKIAAATSNSSTNGGSGEDNAGGENPDSESALLRARAWLSVAAEAASECDRDRLPPSVPVDISKQSNSGKSHSRAVKQLDNASERAMNVSQSPSRKRRTATTTESTFSSDNPRNGGRPASGSLATRQGMPPVAPSEQKIGGVAKRNGPVSAAMAVASTSAGRRSNTPQQGTTTRRQPTVPRSPKFSVMSRGKNKAIDGADSDNNPSRYHGQQQTRGSRPSSGY
jgi:serine/threonine protein kinase